MFRALLPISFLVFAGGCTLIRYKRFTNQQIQEYTTCKAKLVDAKDRMEKAGYDIMTDKKNFFITDWKIDNSADAAGTFGLGQGTVFRKYKVRNLGDDQIQWIETKLLGQGGETRGNDLYLDGPRATIERQKDIIKMICGADLKPKFDPTKPAQ